MPLKRVLISLCFVLLAYSLQAQSATNDAQTTTLTEKDFWSVRWAPLSIFEPHTPSIRLSGEFVPAHFDHKFAFKLDLGYGLEELKRKGDVTEPQEFSMDYRLETKYFPYAESDKWNYYSAEFFFIDHSIGETTGNGRDETGNAYEYNIPSAEINTFGLNAKVGKNYYFSSRDLVLDLYFGVGVRVIDVNRDTVESSKIQSDDTDYIHKGFSLIPDPSDHTGTKIHPNISAGVQFGFNL